MNEMSTVFNIVNLRFFIDIHHVQVSLKYLCQNALRLVGRVNVYSTRVFSTFISILSSKAFHELFDGWKEFRWLTSFSESVIQFYKFVVVIFIQVCSEEL
jgi:hypothetical protein